ncbi:MAG TPA: YdeI/OmpD-associated family protein [Chitinophagaceae bacterium]|nr:YdeI/OmpD-associated family protein [Chitinophagaceae bacterium]
MEAQRNGVEVFYPKSRKEWRAWLQKNGQEKKNVWLLLYNKQSGKPTLTMPEAVEEALCFGWIDSKANKRDEESRYQSFAKRKPGGTWSKINKARVKQLINEGLMQETGMEMIRIAKKNGSWTKLDTIDRLEIPDDLQKALNKNKTALQHFNAFPPSSKKIILLWISTAKTEVTRSKRIAEAVTLAAVNKRANHYQPK